MDTAKEPQSGAEAGKASHEYLRFDLAVEDLLRSTEVDLSEEAITGAVDYLYSDQVMPECTDEVSEALKALRACYTDDIWDESRLVVEFTDQERDMLSFLLAPNKEMEDAEKLVRTIYGAIHFAITSGGYAFVLTKEEKGKLLQDSLETGINKLRQRLGIYDGTKADATKTNRDKAVRLEKPESKTLKEPQVRPIKQIGRRAIKQTVFKPRTEPRQVRPPILKSGNVPRHDSAREKDNIYNAATTFFEQGLTAHQVAKMLDISLRVAESIKNTSSNKPDSNN